MKRSVGLTRAGWGIYVVLLGLSLMGALLNVGASFGLEYLRPGASGFTGRETLWAYARDAIAASPLVGVGELQAVTGGLSVHNAALEITAVLGLTGLLLFSLVFRKSFDAPLGESAAERRTRVMVLPLMVVTLVALFSSAWLSTLGNWTIMGIAAGTLALVARRSSETPVA